MTQAHETADYIVTEAAPPRVAGRVAKPGQTLELTELQARSELLAGAIVPKDADRKDDDPTPSGAFETTDELAQIRARAKGYKGAVVAPAEASTAPAADKASAGTDATTQRVSGGASDAGTSGSGSASTSDVAKTDAGQADAGGPAPGADAGKRPTKIIAAGTGA